MAFMDRFKTTINNYQQNKLILDGLKNSIEAKTRQLEELKEDLPKRQLAVAECTRTINHLPYEIARLKDALNEVQGLGFS